MEELKSSQQIEPKPIIFKAGTIFNDKYEIKRVLGSGGQSYVVLAVGIAKENK